MQSHLCNLVRPVDVKNLQWFKIAYKWMIKQENVVGKMCYMVLAESCRDANLYRYEIWRFPIMHPPPNPIINPTLQQQQQKRQSTPPPITINIFVVGFNPYRQCSCDSNEKGIFRWTMYEKAPTSCNMNMKNHLRIFGIWWKFGRIISAYCKEKIQSRFYPWDLMIHLGDRGIHSSQQAIIQALAQYMIL